MLLPTAENIKTIKVLYYKNGAYVGIPWEMMEGQAPRDLYDRYQHEMIWLGSPGWYGNMTDEQMKLAEEFIKRNCEGINYNDAWGTIEND